MRFLDDCGSGTVSVSPSAGQCPEGQRLTESECAALNGQTVDGITLVYGGAYNTALPETCGCYIDQDGKMYFNTLENSPCNSIDATEQMVCRSQAACGSTSGGNFGFEKFIYF